MKSEPAPGARLQRLFWTLHAVTWDRALSAGAARKRIEDVVGWVGQYDGKRERLLDLGCGTGEMSFALAASGYKVTAVDFSEGMLRRARRKMRPGGSVPEFLWANLDEALPFPDGSFDAALSISVLQCLSCPRRSLAEVRRVLAKGGTLFVRVKSDPGRDVATGGGSLTGRLFSPLKRWASTPRFVRSFTMDGLLEAMSESGFVISEHRRDGLWLSVVAQAA